MKLSIKNLNYKTNKYPRKKLKEVSRGFEPLEENLSGWISDKLDEINADSEKF